MPKKSIEDHFEFEMLQEIEAETEIGKPNVRLNNMYPEFYIPKIEIQTLKDINRWMDFFHEPDPKIKKHRIKPTKITEKLVWRYIRKFAPHNLLSELLLIAFMNEYSHFGQRNLTIPEKTHFGYYTIIRSMLSGKKPDMRNQFKVVYRNVDPMLQQQMKHQRKIDVPLIIEAAEKLTEHHKKIGAVLSAVAQYNINRRELAKALGVTYEFLNNAYLRFNKRPDFDLLNQMKGTINQLAYGRLD